VHWKFQLPLPGWLSRLVRECFPQTLPFAVTRVKNVASPDSGFLTFIFFGATPPSDYRISFDL